MKHKHFHYIINFKRMANLLAICMLAVLMFYTSGNYAMGQEQDSVIHILTLPASTNAVLVESNGKFGMIDSGEDTDYPENPADGVTIEYGFEKDVIDYLRKAGVTKENFVFYIGTHAHSDHIGSADEIIREFRPAKVMTPQYKDEYINDASRLWDNNYVYQRMLKAAKEVGAEIILRFDDKNSTFEFENLIIKLHNARSNYDGLSVPDANSLSLAVEITEKTKGNKAFIGGDIDNFEGVEDKISRSVEKVNLFLVSHHGYKGSNSYSIVDKLNPDVFVVPSANGIIKNDHDPGDINHNPADTILEKLKNGSRFFAQGWYRKKTPALKFSLGGAVEFQAPKLDEETYLISESSEKWSHTYYKIVDGKYVIMQMPVRQGVWISNSVNWKYRDKSGKMISNSFAKIDGKVYSFDEYGIMRTGWHLIQKNWYYFEASGSMITGWKKIADEWYYFFDDGIMANHPVTVNGKLYNIEATGQYRAHYWKKISGKYRLEIAGDMATGWNHVDNVWYYMDKDGWMQTGWREIDNKRYYFNHSGAMLSDGWRKIDGSWYWLESSGHVAYGWKKSGDKWYYLDASNKKLPGVMISNEKRVIENTTYFFDGSGAMRTGWYYENGNWYYLNPSGAMATGWIESGGSWYYLNDDGAMIVNTSTPDGYKVDSSGRYIG